MAVLTPLYIIGGLAILLFLLFWEQWNRAEGLQKELDDLKKQRQEDLAALTDFEKQLQAGIALQRELDYRRFAKRKG